jgi:hypothetical protein
MEHLYAENLATPARMDGFAIIPIAVVFGRSILPGQDDLPLMLVGWVFVTFQTSLVWPGLDLERWRRWKVPASLDCWRDVFWRCRHVGVP